MRLGITLQQYIRPWGPKWLGRHHVRDNLRPGEVLVPPYPGGFHTCHRVHHNEHVATIRAVLCDDKRYEGGLQIMGPEDVQHTVQGKLDKGGTSSPGKELHLVEVQQQLKNFLSVIP